MRVIKPGGLIQLTDNSFTWNGSDTLEIDPISGTLTMRLLRQESNSLWSLFVKVPYDLERYPALNTVLREESCFVVDIGNNISLDYNQYQLFRVYSIERTPTEIQCECEPIFADCRSDMIIDTRPTDKTAVEALDILFEDSKYSVDAVYNGSETSAPTATAYWEWKDKLTALNGDNENSFINRWGGEFFFDNYRLIWRDKIDRFINEGDDKYIKITAGFNMESIEYTVDTSKLVTEIWPQAYNGYHYKENDEYVSIKSSRINNFVKSYSSIIEYSDIKLKEDASDEEDDSVTVCETLDDLYAALKERAEKEYDENKVDIPTITYDVSFIDLSGTVKYEGFDELVKLYLGDTVLVYNEDLDIETTARITEITYDCVNGLITNMVLGDYKKDYVEQQAEQNRVISKVINTEKEGVNGETVVGVQNGENTQIQVTKDETNSADIKVIKFEDTDKTSAHYGAIAFGTEGWMVTKTRLKDNSGWDWSDAVLLNEKGVFYGKLGNSSGTKYIQVQKESLFTYDGGVSGKGITGSITGDGFNTVNGLVVGESQWKPITYTISIVDNTLMLTDSNGNVTSVTLPETKTILTGDTGNGIKSAVLNDDYTLTLTWTNGESYTTPSIRGAQGIQGEQGVQGVKGDKGDKGDSTTITSYKVEYQEGTSSTQAPTGTWYTKPMDVLQGNYLWTRITTNYSDGTVIQSYSIARYGVDGGQGVAGKGISSVVAYYLATGLSSGVTKDSDGWTTTVQNVTSTKKYLWKYELTTWSTGETTTTNPIIIGTYGDKGDKGDNGAQGIKGETGADGKTSYIHIAYANSSDGKIGFSVSNPNGKSYIGHYVDYEENDSTDPTKYTWSKYVGDNGNGIESITNYYGVSASGDTQPTGWSTTIQATNNETPYLWCYEVVTYTDGDTTSTEPRVISIYTSDMASMKPYYYLSTSNDSTNFVEVDGHEWTDTIPSTSELSGKDSDGKNIPYYVWEKFIMTMSDGTTKETEPTLYGMYTDINDAINTNANAIATVSSSVTTTINQAKDSILTQVRSDYVLQDSLNEYKQQMESSIQQTDSSITTTISELNQVSSKIDGLEQTSENVNSYMKFSTDGLELGKSDSQFKTNITNDRMSFTQNGNEVAYFSNNKMYVTDGEFTNSLHIGKFAFVPRVNGSLDFKKVSD